jgi:hypothetical protein
MRFPFSSCSLRPFPFLTQVVPDTTARTEAMRTWLSYGRCETGKALRLQVGHKSAYKRNYIY